MRAWVRRRERVRSLEALTTAEDSSLGLVGFGLRWRRRSLGVKSWVRGSLFPSKEEEDCCCWLARSEEEEEEEVRE